MGIGESKKRRITGLFTLRRLMVARATVLLGHSATLHSHAKSSPHFVGTLCNLKMADNFIKKIILKM
jgi:hypothetical protein